jgi:hypothetical protein
MLSRYQITEEHWMVQEVGPSNILGTFYANDVADAEQFWWRKTTIQGSPAVQWLLAPLEPPVRVRNCLSIGPLDLMQADPVNHQ